MADRLAEPDDAAVDELKRKARRRLVGAVVLALAAAIVVPMLLEREPRPLGDEVSVKIPPVDDGKFVNRLNGPKSDAAPKVGTKADMSSTNAAQDGSAPSGTPPKSITEAEQRVLAPPSPTTALPPIPPAEKAAPRSDKGVAAGDNKIEPAQPSVPPKAAVVTRSEPPKQENVAINSAPNASPAASPRAEGFVVQLAAFADDKGANALAGKLKRAGYPAYTETVQTSRGTLWRVRVGSYPSRDAASEARTKLKNDGYSGIVASAQ